MKKSFDLLEKQAANRRAFLIERHVERVKTVEYFLRQRDQLERLTRENLSVRNETKTTTTKHLLLLLFFRLDFETKRNFKRKSSSRTRRTSSHATTLRRCDSK